MKAARESQSLFFSPANQVQGGVQSEPESSELEVSTIAGDQAEELVKSESGKGEGGPREGSEDAGPGEGTIAAEPMELIDNAGSWDMDNLR